MEVTHDAKKKKKGAGRVLMRVAAVVALMVLAAVVLGSLIKGSRESGASNSNLATFAARRGTLEIAVTEAGTLRTKDPIKITPEMSGEATIAELIEEGTLVKEGDVLIVLDKTQLEEREASQAIELENAQAQRVRSREDKRIQEINNTTSIAKAILTLISTRMELVKYGTVAITNEGFLDEGIYALEGLSVDDDVYVREKAAAEEEAAEVLRAQQAAEKAIAEKEAAEELKAEEAKEAAEAAAAEKEAAEAKGAAGETPAEPEAEGEGDGEEVDAASDETASDETASDETAAEADGQKSDAAEETPAEPEAEGEGDGKEVDAASEETDSDETSAEETTSNEVASDEDAAEADGQKSDAAEETPAEPEAEGEGDGEEVDAASDETASDETDSEETASDEAASDEAASDETASEEVEAEDTIKFAPVKGEAYQAFRDAELEIRRAETAHENALRAIEGMDALVEKGFKTRNDYLKAELGVLEAERKLESSRLKHNILRTYTHPKKRAQLDANVTKASGGLKEAQLSATSRMRQKEAAIEQAQRSYLLRKKRLDETRDQLSKMIIKAPEAGIVIYGDERRWWDKDRIKVGGKVYRGMVLITLPRVTKMLAAIEIPEKDINKFKVDQSAVVTLQALPDIELTGKVSKIASVATQQSRHHSSDVKTFEVEVAFDEQDSRMKPGMSCKTRVLIETIHDAIYVPVNAVFDMDDQDVCYVVAGGKTKMVPVEKGKSNDIYIEITEGLAEGQEVMLYAVEPSETVEAIGKKKEDEDAEKETDAEKADGGDEDAEKDADAEADGEESDADAEKAADAEADSDDEDAEKDADAEADGEKPDADAEKADGGDEDGEKDADAEADSDDEDAEKDADAEAESEESDADEDATAESTDDKKE